MPTYGIDLGTTKSVIGIGDKLSTPVPSVANLQIDRAGTSQYDNYGTWTDEKGITHPDTIRNYKVDMQTSADGSGAIASSACVLRELKRVMSIDPNAPIDAVISVPAYFSVDQCLATRQAAEYAKINVKALIKEPTAAALYLHKGQDGFIAVFDLGGGTFDVSILRMESGKATVLATDGCILGGRDFDTALGKMLQKKGVVSVLNATDEYYSWVKRLKERACNNPIDVPSHLQFPSTVVTTCPYNIVELDMRDYSDVQEEVFKRTIDITRSAFKMAGVKPADVSFYFVGGSCMCTYLRKRVEDALGIVAMPTHRYDMNKAVVHGAVYYASLIDEGVATNFMQDASKILSMCVDDAPLLKILVYKNTGMPAKVTQAYSLSECAMRNELKQSYEVKIFYGDCPVNAEFWNKVRESDDQVEDNNQLVKAVTVNFEEEVTCKEDTIVIVESVLMGDGHLKISIKVPMQEAVIIDEVIVL